LKLKALGDIPRNKIMQHKLESCKEKVKLSLNLTVPCHEDTDSKPILTAPPHVEYYRAGTEPRATLAQPRTVHIATEILLWPTQPSSRSSQTKIYWVYCC